MENPIVTRLGDAELQFHFLKLTMVKTAYLKESVLMNTVELVPLSMSILLQGFCKRGLSTINGSKRHVSICST